VIIPPTMGAAIQPDYDCAFGLENGSLDEVCQLPDISRPELGASPSLASAWIAGSR
jgi:hypothetical protein